MNLLMVLHQYLPRHMTGTEQYVRSLAMGFDARGHKVRIFAFEPLMERGPQAGLYLERDEVVDGIPVRRVAVHPELAPNRELADYENPLAEQLFGRYLDEHPVDLVHVFHARLAGAGVIEEPRARGIPVVVNLMDFWFLCPNFLLLRRDGELCDGPPDGGMGCIPCIAPDVAAALEGTGLTDSVAELAAAAGGTNAVGGSPARRALALVRRKDRLFGVLARADAVIAPSRFLRSVFEDQGFPRQRILHVPYGLDDRRFRNAGGRTPGRNDAAEPPAGRGAGPPALGYVGSLTPHKGVHVLIEAVRLIPERDLRLEIHGDLDANPAYASVLRDLAADDPRIRFRSAFEPDRLGQVLGELDLLVVPSIWYENTPFSVLEALHAGLPVLASDLGGITELVEDGVNGLVFPAGDSRALADAITRILDDPARLAGLAGDRAETIEANLDRFESIYAPLLVAAGT